MRSQFLRCIDTAQPTCRQAGRQAGMRQDVAGSEGSHQFLQQLGHSRDLQNSTMASMQRPCKGVKPQPASCALASVQKALLNVSHKGQASLVPQPCKDSVWPCGWKGVWKGVWKGPVDQVAGMFALALHSSGVNAVQAQLLGQPLRHDITQELGLC